MLKNKLELDSKLEHILSKMIEAIKKACVKINELYDSCSYDVNYKEDKSPVTTADFLSNKIIHEELAEFKDMAGFLSEEDDEDNDRLNKKYVFIFDPLDGTNDFVNRDNSFSVNLALVYEGKPILAVIGLPRMNGYCYAVKDKGAYSVFKNKTRRIHSSSRTKKVIFVESMSNASLKDNEVYKRHEKRVKKIIKAGASTKAYLIAAGKADISIRYTDKTKEWDTCASDLIIRESGGYFTDTSLHEFTYNKEDVVNHNGYCMFNTKENCDLLK